MKKNRKMITHGDIVQFTSEFKLRESIVLRQRPRAGNSARGIFRQLGQEAMGQIKGNKSAVPNLTFSVVGVDNNFKLPTSNRKRSNNPSLMHKTSVSFNSKSLFETSANASVLHEKRHKRDSKILLLDLKRDTKGKSQIKQKLQKSARQKFNEAIATQNDENKDVVSSENAEELYQILATARMKNYLGYRKIKRQQLELRLFVDKKWVNAQKKELQPEEGKGERNNADGVESEICERKGEVQTRAEDQQARLSFLKMQYAADSISPIKQRYVEFNQPPVTNQTEEDSAKLENEVVADNVLAENKQEQIQKDAKNSPIQQKKVSNLIEEVSAPIVQSLERQLFFKEEKPIQKLYEDKELPVKQKHEVVAPKSIFTDLLEKQPVFEVPEIAIFHKEEKKTYKESGPNSPLIDRIDEKREVTTTKSGKQTKPKTALNKKGKHIVAIKNYQEITTQNRNMDQQIEEISLGHQTAVNKKLPQTIKRQEKQKKSNLQNNVKKQNVQKQIQSKVTLPIKEQKKEDKEVQESQVNPLIFYIDRIQDVVRYRHDLKNFGFDKPVEKELAQIQTKCSYFMAHQALYLQQTSYQFLKNIPYKLPFYDISVDTLGSLKRQGIIQQTLEEIEEDMKGSKKVAVKTGKQSGDLLKKEDVVQLDGKVNFYGKCCQLLNQQFDRFYRGLSQSGIDKVSIKRCLYLIETYCTLSNLNGKKIKEYQQFDKIQRPLDYLKQYQQIMKPIKQQKK